MPSVGPGTGTRLWTPLDGGVNGRLSLWLDASNTGSITHDSAGLVSRWADLSGAGNHAVQGTGTNQPQTGTRVGPNGKNVIDFDGTDNYMTSTLTASSRTQTIFVVLLTDVDTGTATTDVMGPSGSGGREIQLRGFGVERFAFNKSWASVEASYSLVDPAISTPYVLMFASGAANVIWSMNAAAEETDTTATTLTGGLTTVIGSEINGSPSSYWNGWFAEFVVYDTQLDPASRTKVRNYLGAKWAIPGASGACSPPLVFA